MTRTPDNNAQTLRSPKVDALSEGLEAVRFAGGHIAAHVSHRTDNAVCSESLRSLIVVRKGMALFRGGARGEPVNLGPGDIVLLAFGSSFSMSWRGPPADEVQAARAPCEWLHCTFDLDAPLSGRLLGCLPEMVVLRQLGGSAMHWLEIASMFALVEIEADEPGASVMIARIVELLIIRVLRLWAVDPAAPASWLVGATDPAIGRALAAMHACADRQWTVPRLAEMVGMSRSVFAKRFVELVGQPPLRYLTGLRLDKAAELLRRTGGSIGEIAAAVGYESEPAFSRAFKDRHGLSPSHWRRG